MAKIRGNEKIVTGQNAADRRVKFAQRRHISKKNNDIYTFWLEVVTYGKHQYFNFHKNLL